MMTSVAAKQRKNWLWKLPRVIQQRSKRMRILTAANATKLSKTSSTTPTSASKKTTTSKTSPTTASQTSKRKVRKRRDRNQKRPTRKRNKRKTFLFQFLRQPQKKFCRRVIKRDFIRVVITFWVKKEKEDMPQWSKYGHKGTKMAWVSVANFSWAKL